MSKIRLTQPGWETFTGNFGGVDFTDGVSNEDVAPVHAKQLANIVSLENEDGKNPSASQQALDSRAYVPIADTMQMNGFQRPAAPVAAPIKTEYSREELEAIATEKGLKGLRDIAAPLGVKANSISAMIDSLLQFYKSRAAKERSLTGIVDTSQTAEDSPNDSPQTGETGTNTGESGETNAQENPPPALYGSDVLPALVDIKGEQVQLGTLVASAHQRSGLTAEAWNALEPADRDKLLADELALLNAAE